MTTRPVRSATSDQPTDPAPGGWFRRTAIAHPIMLLLGVATVFVWTTQMASALAGVDLMPAKLAELLVLLGLAVAITRATDGRGGVRQLFAGLLRWRLGWRYLLLLLPMPLLTDRRGRRHRDLPRAGWGMGRCRVDLPLLPCAWRGHRQPMGGDRVGRPSSRDA